MPSAQARRGRPRKNGPRCGVKDPLLRFRTFAHGAAAWLLCHSYVGLPTKSNIGRCSRLCGAIREHWRYWHVSFGQGEGAERVP